MQSKLKTTVTTEAIKTPAAHTDKHCETIRKFKAVLIPESIRRKKNNCGRLNSPAEKGQRRDISSRKSTEDSLEGKLMDSFGALPNIEQADIIHRLGKLRET